MVWQTALAFLLLLVLALGMITGPIVRHRRMVGLRRDHRIISWEEALRRICAGHGAIVENLTSLPGRYWWIEDPDGVDSLDLYDEVAQRGLCVEDPPSRRRVDEIVSERALSERYRRIEAEALVDP